MGNPRIRLSFIYTSVISLLVILTFIVQIGYFIRLQSKSCLTDTFILIFISSLVLLLSVSLGFATLIYLTDQRICEIEELLRDIYHTMEDYSRKKRDSQ